MSTTGMTDLQYAIDGAVYAISTRRKRRLHNNSQRFRHGASQVDLLFADHYRHREIAHQVSPEVFL